MPPPTNKVRYSLVQISKKRTMSAGSRFLIRGYVLRSAASAAVVGAVPVSPLSLSTRRCNRCDRGSQYPLGRYMRNVRGVVYQLEPESVWELCHVSWVRLQFHTCAILQRIHRSWQPENSENLSQGMSSLNSLCTALTRFGYSFYSPPPTKLSKN